MTQPHMTDASFQVVSNPAAGDGYARLSGMIGWLFAILTFFAVWILGMTFYGASGFFAGWIPALILAAVIGFLMRHLWPLALIGFLAVWILHDHRAAPANDAPAAQDSFP